MKRPSELVKDMIGKNYMECSKCKKDITNAQIGGMVEIQGHRKYWCNKCWRD